MHAHTHGFSESDPNIVRQSRCLELRSKARLPKNCIYLCQNANTMNARKNHRSLLIITSTQHPSSTKIATAFAILQAKSATPHAAFKNNLQRGSCVTLMSGSQTQHLILAIVSGKMHKKGWRLDMSPTYI